MGTHWHWRHRQIVNIHLWIWICPLFRERKTYIISLELRKIYLTTKTRARLTKKLPLPPPAGTFTFKTWMGNQLVVIMKYWLRHDNFVFTTKTIPECQINLLSEKILDPGKCPNRNCKFWQNSRKIIGFHSFSGFGIFFLAFWAFWHHETHK